MAASSSSSSWWSLEYVVKVAMGVAAAGIVGLGAYRDRSRQQGIVKSIERVAKEVGDDIHSPPTMLLMGFHHHGKSSFINSLFRAMRKESGPLIRRAETGPTTTLRPTTLRYKPHHIVDDHATVLFTLLDSPPLPDHHAIDPEAIRSFISNPHIPSPHCVLLILSAAEITTQPELLDALETITTTIREEGLQFLIIMTFKLGVSEESLNRVKQEVCSHTASESVYYIENYVEQSIPDPRRVVEWSYYTVPTIMEIIKQALEFCR